MENPVFAENLDPALYIAALSALSADPANVIAVEDSVSGVRSATTAGIRVVAVTSASVRMRLQEAGAILVVNNLGALLRVLQLISRLQSSFAMKCNHADIRLRSAQYWTRRVCGRYAVASKKFGKTYVTKSKLPQFEGTILNALDFVVSDDGVTIECGLMLYRCLVARSYENLPSIKPVAVSGFVEKKLATGDRAILLGRRSADSSTHSGWYETPPSGGLEVADVNSDGSIDITKRFANRTF